MTTVNSLNHSRVQYVSDKIKRWVSVLGYIYYINLHILNAYFNIKTISIQTSVLALFQK